MTFDFPLAGEIFSVVSALAWAIAVILLRRSGEHASPVPLTLFKNVLALALLVATILALGAPLLPREQPLVAWAKLLASGFLGLGVCDVLFLACLNRIGAGRAAIVECCYSPSVIVCAHFYLNEEVRPALLVAVALVVAAVLVGSWEPPTKEEAGIDRRTLAVGALLGVAAMVVMSIGIVLAKPVLNAKTTDPWWATATRLAGGLVLPAVLGLARSTTRAEVARVFTPSRAWRITVPAAIVGTYLSMTLFVFGMTFAPTTKASVLNQTSTVFTIVLATIVLREPLTRRKVIAIALGCAGGVLAAI